MREWIADDKVGGDFLQTIRNGVIDTGRNLSEPLGGSAKDIACAVTEDFRLMGGATGRTEFGRLFVNFLWVDQQWRGTGLGAEALHRLEALAIERGCMDSIIETLDDEVAGWYQRIGYELIAQIPKYCGPWNRHILLKSLTG
ncbi:GNAT family N-acetyltransferase [Pseudomonas alliivorans]|uniref:GNAT family N-acetyltransferase n=1 Tax=Pseudomonas viridiflava TaxID=33069 RepID=UPI000C08A2FE|nr:GNAT family N-acetyltransferase [Pseudomonas viridiflava]MEE4575751.1 GNAT family N-acetyltransferase [Pseudomonas alliivorans]MEE4705221.1 GNAT family N-acetyltransferase [Pseudomonas alliivorans]MEE4776840.1 GNAT family N-acetyltransferase [Pseudomonas alliivorans]MEE5135742.1 GNAT family N-acetyltransferase [Pseudomonas alliivorans]PHN62048.1 GCN5 family acetyltransferase [Pseudomonas viridiflava]